MNEASLSPNYVLIRTILVCTICAFLGSVSVQAVKANGAPPPDPTVGGASPYQPQKTDVQMMAETVFIDVPPLNGEEPPQIKVKADFTMRNQGKIEEQMEVIFPLTRLNTFRNEESLYEIDISSFTAKVNGQPVPFTTITTPPEVTATDMEHGFIPEVRWAAFEVTFPVQQDVTFQVEYEMLNPYRFPDGAYENFTGIAYILETGAGWYGNILSAEITLRLPYQIEEIALYYAKPGYVISGRELHWNLKDFEPTRDDNLDIRVVEEEHWQAIVDLRSKVKRNPNNADSWVELAGGYESLSIFNTMGGYGFGYGLNHRTSDLAVEARRKVVELRPEWGDAHFWLARILWYTNPKVEAFWSESNDTIQPNDPSIQEVLHELDLAWSYGLSEDIANWQDDELLPMINRTVPGLNLVPPGSPTLTPIPPTQRPVPTITNTSVPTDTPTIVPTVSPTSIAVETLSTSRNNILFIVALGLIMASGFFVFRLKSK
jgi:hypothetical protein